MPYNAIDFERSRLYKKQNNPNKKFIATASALSGGGVPLSSEKSTDSPGLSGKHKDRLLKRRRNA